MKLKILCMFVDDVQRDEAEKTRPFVKGLNLGIRQIIAGLDLCNFRFVINKDIQL